MYSRRSNLPLPLCSQRVELALSRSLYKDPACKDLANKDPTTSLDPLGAESKLPQITIDGISLRFHPGETIMQVAERGGLTERIARFCYHPALSIAGTCRMCTVEVEKSPKLLTSCSTPASDGMVVHTHSPKVKQSRNGVMEFLLANHPLDCPVCDQSGECYLQDYNYQYGPATSCFTEEKRVYEQKTTSKLSDKITLNMNRCVHCERCVRFCAEVTKTNDLFMQSRGWKKTLTLTDEDLGLTSDYQGCLADICPVGALTFNDFRFQKRVWFLEKAESICDGCSQGCNLEVHSENGHVYRYIPRYNSQVNGHFICDEGRLSYRRAENMSKERILHPTLYGKNSSWSTLLREMHKNLANARSVLAIFATDASNEEVSTIVKTLQQLYPAAELVGCYYTGQSEINSPADDHMLDQLLRRKDKTANTQGVYGQLGTRSLGTLLMDGSHLLECDVAIFFKGAVVQLSHLVTIAPTLANKVLYLWGAIYQQDLELLKAWRVQAVLPGPHTIEKSGSYTNYAGVTQTFQAAVPAPDYVSSVDKIVNKLISIATS